MGLFGQSTREMEEQDEALEAELSMSGNKTRISSNITFEGKIFGDGVIEIEGTVIGEIKSLGSVTIKKTGVVKGPICAGNLNVAGKVEGNVTASDYLVLEATGSITGDIITKSLEIVSGGLFNGKSVMLEDENHEPDEPVEHVDSVDLNKGASDNSSDTAEEGK